ncbi:DNA repair protein [Hasllibacter halocynthiae]|nr:DNA repair protein [Hasllibacter halocynthiae]
MNLRLALQYAGIGIVALAATAAVVATLASALGVLPWLDLSALGLAGAGPWVQAAGAALLVALASFLPGATRVLRLEHAHRSFNLKMEDVARAYHVAHADDRAGAFRMKHEFDAVRERLAHLREHPELSAMEPDVLEVAAQMSAQSARLASVYSDEKVDRARRFLEQRQEEVERTRELIAKAHHSGRELKKWVETIELEEQVTDNQLVRLEEELDEVLPRLGFSRVSDHHNVVRMPPATAAE